MSDKEKFKNLVLESDALTEGFFIDIGNFCKEYLSDFSLKCPNTQDLCPYITFMDNISGNGRIITKIIDTLYQLDRENP